MHAHRHAQCRLPIALGLMSDKVKIPVRHAIQLTEHPRTSILMGRALRLLRRGVFMIITEHIDPRQRKTAVRAHRLAQRRCLGMQRWLLHHMSRERQSMCITPTTQRICVGTDKTLTYMIMVAIAYQGGLPFGQFPKEFW